MIYFTNSNLLIPAIFIYLLVSASIFFSLIGCSSSQEAGKVEKETKEEEVYVFDEIPPEDTFKLESPVQQTYETFVVQIGAFSTLERARQHAEDSRAKLNKDIKVEFNNRKNLYVVWIHPPYEERSLAEAYRNILWTDEDYKDAWIVTIESK